MRKSLLALAAAAAASSSVHAQSSVIVYGVADSGLEYATNVATASGSGNRFAVVGGGLSSSRWGLRGIEDLGSGLSAQFVLESGFGIDNGQSAQGGRLFGRQAFVGLESKSIGRISFGRQYTAMFDVLANFSPGRYATLYEPTTALLGVAYRSDNTAKYTGNFGPVSLIAHWSFGNGAVGNGEVPGQFRRDTGYGAGATYMAGPFGAAISYDQVNPSVTTGTTFVGTGTVKKAAAALSYAFGDAKIMAGYRFSQGKNQADQTASRDDMYWIGANYQVTPAFGLTLDYYYQNSKPVTLGGITTSPDNPWQVMLIGTYSLSKRTDLYLSTAYAKHAGLAMDTALIAFANGYRLDPSKDNMFGATIGIRHKF